MNNLELHNIFIESKISSKKLMIILHGRGDSSEGFTSLAEFLDIPQMNYLLLDAPFEYFSGFSWYQLPPKQLPGIQYSSQILTKVLDEVFNEKFNAQESFLFGFSQGSLLTFEFGARYKKKLAGYIAVSGYIYDADKLLIDMNKDLVDANWLCTHGKQDNVLEFDISQKQIQTLQNGGFNIDFRAYEKDHSIALDELEMISGWVKDIMQK
jgi:phospholipase/carboxylesterase